MQDKMLVMDSSAWLAMFDAEPAVKAIIENQDLITPSIALAEVAKILKQRGNSDETIESLVSKIKRESTILSLDENNAALAGVLSIKNHFDFVDGVIYSYAAQDRKVVSTDGDFKNKPFAIYVDLRKKK